MCALKEAFPLLHPLLSMASQLKTSIFVSRCDDQITAKMSRQDLHFSPAVLLLLGRGHQSRVKSLLPPLAHLILILRQSFKPRH